MSTLPTSTSAEIDRVADLIKDVRVAFLTTVAADGKLHARPMGCLSHRFDGTLWFFTRAESEKVDEVVRDRDVAVTYQNTSGNDYVAVAGKATVVRDRAKAKELWNPILKAWFPDGLDDPQLELLRIDVQTASWWDGPASKFVRLYEYAKAIATHTTAKMGDQGTVNLQPTTR